MKDVNVEKDGRLVIGYVRESTMEQAVEGFNLEGQQKKIRQYCETFDLGEPTFLVEKGKSGKSLNRNKVKELVKLVKHDKVKTVIVQKLDRLTRNIVDLSDLMKLFQTHDVTLISMYEKFDTHTANGMFAAKLFILLAEQELEQISERTKWGLAESYAQGNYVIGGKVARGYKRVNGKLEINEEEVPVIKEIFERSANGEPPLPISLDLYARNEFNLKWDERAE
jgi:site-specific DNA recombinase